MAPEKSKDQSKMIRFCIVLLLTLCSPHSIMADETPRESFFDIARMFPSIFILCIDKRCDQHRRGSVTSLWPIDLQERIVLFNGRDLHYHFKQLEILKIKENGRPYHKLINTLFFSHMIYIAKQSNLKKVLYLEDDFNPITVFPKNLLSPLQDVLNLKYWELLRFGANFPINSKCSKNCQCKDFNGRLNKKLCTTQYKSIKYENGYNYKNIINIEKEYFNDLVDDNMLEYSCDLRSSIGVAIHENAYHDIIEMYKYIIWLLNNRVYALCNKPKDKLLINKSSSSSDISNNNDNDFKVSLTEIDRLNKDFIFEYNINYTTCIEHQNIVDWEIVYKYVPWLDIWISSSFKNVYFIPALINQKNMKNIGVEFGEACFMDTE